jgi:hypothetical protein
MSGGDPLRAVALASMMAIVSGTLCILAGVARLGFVTELLSKPIRYGYMNGIALTVLISQLPKLFGFSTEGHGPLTWVWAFAEAVLAGRTNWAALAVGAGALVTILLLKGSKRVPGILIAVVGATVVVGALDLAARADVSVLGSLPQGLPAFAIPWIAYEDLVPVLIGGAAVALVSFADTSVLSRTYAARTGTYVDPNQEMVGLGAANLAAGLFQGFPISSSSSRTPVAEAAGARTQLAGVVAVLQVAAAAGPVIGAGRGRSLRVRRMDFSRHSLQVGSFFFGDADVDCFKGQGLPHHDRPAVLKPGQAVAAVDYFFNGEVVDIHLSNTGQWCRISSVISEKTALAGELPGILRPLFCPNMQSFII